MKECKKWFAKIALIDKCLLIFMVLLLMQSIYTLFAHEVASQDTADIDVMIRTTSAAIFGYFLSANFLKHCSDPVKKKPALPDQPDRDSSLNQSDQTNPKQETSKQQIIIATIIGLVSLCVLLIARNFAILTPEANATLSQMRDFVSGCVGFLIGISGDPDKSCEEEEQKVKH